MTCAPSVRKLVVKAACPEPFTAFERDKIFAPSLNVTVPTVTGLLLDVTVAVNVTLLLGADVKDGFKEDEIVVAVGELAAAVVMFRLQPPVMEAEGLPTLASETMNKLHVPFGLVPLKVEARLALPAGCERLGEDGAGEGNTGTAGGVQAVGLYVWLPVPLAKNVHVDTLQPGTPGSASSKVSVAPLNVTEPSPGCAIKTSFAPVGPTKRALIPLGSRPGVEIPDSVTVSREIVPANPETLTVEGYAEAFCGLACVPLGTVIAPEFEKAVCARVRLGLAAQTAMKHPKKRRRKFISVPGKTASTIAEFKADVKSFQRSAALTY